MYEYLKELKFVPQTVLDIGAWNGFWTKNCKEFWPKAHYTCIEAGPKHKTKLKKCANEVHIAVLGNKNKKVTMYFNKAGYTKGASIINRTPYSEERNMETLESLVGLRRYDFIKQDVQGAEMLIMEGAPEIFKRATYVLNEVENNDVKEMNAYMKKLGFNNSEIIADHPGYNQVDKIYWK
tara:strand:+ start:73 stop:612 length:540 start_codon:yes stop_codon:yes gene_type:complete